MELGRSVVPDRGAVARSIHRRRNPPPRDLGSISEVVVLAPRSRRVGLAVVASLRHQCPLVEPVSGSLPLVARSLCDGGRH